jgi:DNA-binding NarL/FixJ family response regulator
MDVLLVDDHPLIHETLGAVVRSVMPDAAFHAELDLAAGLARARRLRNLELVLLDLGLPGCSGIQALLRFRKALPRVRIAVVSATEDSASVRAALDAGAVGYLPKTSSPKVIAAALRLVADGGTYIPAQAMQSGEWPRKATTLSDLGLTERQADVLRLLAQGLSNRDIARKLRIAENTVKQHVHVAFRALGASSRTEAVVALARLGIKPD